MKLRHLVQDNVALTVAEHPRFVQIVDWLKQDGCEFYYRTRPSLAYCGDTELVLATHRYGKPIKEVTIHSMKNSWRELDEALSILLFNTLNYYKLQEPHLYEKHVETLLREAPHEMYVLQ